VRIGAALRLARAGDVRSRLTAARDGQAAVRVAAVAAGLRTGLLDLLDQGPASTSALATRGGWSDQSLLTSFLLMLSELGLVRGSRSQWQLARRGRAVLADDVVRAMYEAFDGYHTGLYRELEEQLSGKHGRRDVAERGELIARLSRAMDPFVTDFLHSQLQEAQPRTVLDIGCGSGSHLVHMLRMAPDATGTGIETDPAAAGLARTRLADESLSHRARIVEGDVRQVLGSETESFELVLLANMIYYLPADERLPLLRAVAERVAHGGTVVVVTTALTDAVFSRHFDLLLRAQAGDMGLPSVADLSDQLRAAGLTPGRPRRIALGEPLTAVPATRL
jgi:predicted O-methyltransferase YrrM